MYVSNQNNNINLMINKPKLAIKNAISLLILWFFTISIVIPSQYAQAQSVHNLPQPGLMVSTSPSFIPPMLKGLIIHPTNPFQFDFVLDSGDADLNNKEINAESTKLIKYFLASLTIPENELWVNLSPYEDDRIIPDEFGKTEMGQALLSQDYLLKQLTASLLYPEDDLGKSFWDRVYKEANERYGTSEIPVNTFNKVWIIPDKALIHENGDRAFIVESHLKVMLEKDYLATKENHKNQEAGTDQIEKNRIDDLNDVSSKVIRDIIIPEIENEVNNGEQFAQLRQIYHSFILASWYKKNLQQSILNQTYSNKKKTVGLETEEKNAKEIIYQQYVKAFEQGVYDFIKEDYDKATQEVVPRKYFSGGVELTDEAQLTERKYSPDGKVYRIASGLHDPNVTLKKDIPEGSPAEALVDLVQHREAIRDQPITVQGTRAPRTGGQSWRRINSKSNESFSETTIRSELNMLSRLGFLTKRAYKKRVEQGKIVSEYQYFLSDWVLMITAEQLELILSLEGFNQAIIPKTRISAIKESIEEILPEKRKAVVQAQHSIDALTRFLKKVEDGKSLNKFEQEELKSIFIEYGFSHIANRDSVDSDIMIEGLLFIVSKFDSSNYEENLSSENQEVSQINRHIISQLSNTWTAHEMSHYVYPCVNLMEVLSSYSDKFDREDRVEVERLSKLAERILHDNFPLRYIFNNFSMYKNSLLSIFLLEAFKTHLEEAQSLAEKGLVLAKKYQHLGDDLKSESENADKQIGEMYFMRQSIRIWEKQKPMDFNESLSIYYEIEDIVSMLGRNLGRDISLNLNIGFEESIHFSKYDLHNLLKVLIDNSSQSVSKERKLEISVEVSKRDSEKGSVIEIIVKDNGSGMSEEQVRKIKNGEKFSTKGRFGSGQGLEAVRELVSKYSGSLDVESEQGVGTTFKLRFPIDNAMLNSTDKKGGIDFNPNYLDIQTQGNRFDLPLPANSMEMQNIEINGLVPFIINITPVTNLPVLMGEGKMEENEPLARLN